MARLQENCVEIPSAPVCANCETSHLCVCCFGHDQEPVCWLLTVSMVCAHRLIAWLAMHLMLLSFAAHRFVLTAMTLHGLAAYWCYR